VAPGLTAAAVVGVAAAGGGGYGDRKGYRHRKATPLVMECGFHEKFYR
jgi:hypothetical protein